MIDGPSTLPLSASERLSLLQTRRSFWRTLTLGAPSATIQLPGLCQAYDLVGGYYGRCAGPSDIDPAAIDAPDRRLLTLVTLPSSNPLQDVKVETHDVGVQTKDFAMDPSQDMIALLEMPRPDERARLHLRRLSEPGINHPEAAVDILEGRTGSFIDECMLDIADDVVALYVRQLAPRVIIFNWKTGEELVVSAEIFVHWIAS